MHHENYVKRNEIVERLAIFGFIKFYATLESYNVKKFLQSNHKSSSAEFFLKKEMIK